MKKATPIWPKIILLLVLAAAGLFLYLNKKNNPGPPEEILPKPAHRVHHQETIKGKVVEYGGNPDGDIDKILVSFNNENTWLHFPPHAARTLMEAAPVNAQIEVDVEQGGPRGHLKSVRNLASGEEVNLAEIPAPAPREGIETTIKGAAGKDFKNENGNAFSLSGKLVSLPPHMARELFPLIHQAKKIVVRGKMRDTTEGFVSASGKPVIKANSIQLDSITYKIR